MPPRIIGPYEILALLGRGGIGTVYRARDGRTGQQLALKLIGPVPAMDPNSARRLAREFEALKDLDHPNVIRVFEAGVAEGYSYLAMELVEGLDLRCYLSPGIENDPQLDRSEMPTDPSSRSSGGEVFDLEAFSQEPATDGFLHSGSHVQQGPEAIRAFAELLEEPETEPSGSAPWPGRPPDPAVPPRAPAPPPPPPEPEVPVIPASFAEELNDPRRLARLRHALAQVCRGLAYVHSRGLVHRDLKPSNIMVDDHRRARIMDFGLVKSMDEGHPLTHSGRVVGTYRYMSPEQAQGKGVDARSDLFSLGVILYELLSGRPPFLAQRPSELWHEIVERYPPPLLRLNPGTEPLLARIAERLLRKSPAERYSSASEVTNALEE